MCPSSPDTCQSPISFVNITVPSADSRLDSNTQLRSLLPFS